jgi:hypothetical protein
MAGQSPLSMMQADRQRIRRRPNAAVPRRRLWPIVASLIIVAVLAVAWCGLWYLAADTADRTLAGWVTREAAAGRVYSCGSQGIAGFPFRVEAHCVAAAATLSGTQLPFAVAAKEITFTAQVYHPTQLVGDVTGPVTVAQPGQSSSFLANWTLAQLTVSGVPPDPDSASITVQQPHIDHVESGRASTLFAAANAELRARIVGGSAGNHPVIDATLRFSSATAPTVHPLLAEPLQGTVDVLLRGFADLSPKPLAARFRELQATGGNIEIRTFRFERADAVVVGAGTLTVNEHGRLDGDLRVAVSGLENIVPLLGIDRLIDQGIGRLTGANSQPGQGLSALDRLMPGLSGVVRQGANASVIDDLKKMGEPTEIDNKPAVVLPLRLSDGAIYLGMLRIGEVPPLF